MKVSDFSIDLAIGFFFSAGAVSLSMNLVANGVPLYMGLSISIPVLALVFIRLSRGGK